MQSLKFTPYLTICVRSLRIFELPASKSIRCHRFNSIQMRHRKLPSNLKMAAVFGRSISSKKKQQRYHFLSSASILFYFTFDERWHLCCFFLFEKLRHMTVAIMRFTESLGCLNCSTVWNYIFSITYFLKWETQKCANFSRKLWGKEWILDFAHALIMIFRCFYMAYNYPEGCSWSLQRPI